MAADVETVWSLVSDITRIGSYSPETFEAEWLDGADGPAVGARFRGHVKRNGRGPVYWTLCVVTACDPGREFAFDVMVNGRAVNTWRYEMTGTEGGTSVTESFQLPPNLPTRIYWAMFGRARGRTNERGMRQTLEAMRAVAESSPSPAGG